MPADPATAARVRRRAARALGAGLLATVMGCTWEVTGPRQSGRRPGEEQAEEIARWMGRLGSGHYPAVERARFELQALGRDAVPALRDAARNGGAASAEAIVTLMDMGPGAREAMPLLLDIAADRDDRDPPAWPSRLSRRKVVLESARLAGWADEQWTPVLEQVWQDPAEDLDHRRLAVESLIGMGVRGAESLLRVLTEGPPPLRAAADHTLRGWLAARGLDREQDYHAWLLRADPLGADAPSHAQALRAVGPDADTLAACREAKAALWSHFQESGDPDVALRLAGILQQELVTDWLAALVPDTTRIQGAWRYDPRVELGDLEEVIQAGFERAPPGSRFRNVLGVGLARLRLLAGDWAGMNAALEAMGRAGVPAEDRAWMTAPPRNWLDPSRPWRRAPEALCSGPCTLVVQVEWQGFGFPGAQVVLRPVDEDTWDPATGAGMDPRLHFVLDPAPLSLIPTGGFGMPPGLEEGTRYGVTGADGQVTLEGLPGGPWEMTLLVPVSTLPGMAGPFTLMQDLGTEGLLLLRPDQPPRSLDPLMLQPDAPTTLRYLIGKE